MVVPLYQLLQKDSKLVWEAAQEEVFSRVKLSCSLQDCYFITIISFHSYCHVKTYGVGAVLSHITEEGKDQPTAFASRSLAPAEKNYSQLDKEALAIIFGVKKFHQYVFGRTFTIHSDHKPLLRIFRESKTTLVMVSARMQRWAVLLSAYNYTISYRPGREQANADALSRLPLPEAPKEVPVPAETNLLLEHFSSLPVSA